MFYSNFSQKMVKQFLTLLSEFETTIIRCLNGSALVPSDSQDFLAAIGDVVRSLRSAAMCKYCLLATTLF